MDMQAFLTKNKGNRLDEYIKLTAQMLDLDKYDNVTISLSHPEFTQYVSYPSEKFINLAEGSQTYELNAYLTTFGNLVGGYMNPLWVMKSSEIDGSDTLTIIVVKYNPSTDEEGFASVLNDEKIVEDKKPKLS